MKPSEDSIAVSSGDQPRRHTRFMARQPILNVRQEVAAYELLFRTGWENAFSGDDDGSTRQIIDNILVLGARTLCSDTLAFINCTREALTGELVTLLPPEFIVLEVLESIEPDAEIISACRSLKAMGYRIALDDFVLRKGIGPMIELADYIKVDFLASGRKARKQIRSALSGCGAALLAEKIEDQEAFSVALAEGYQYFQGYFFSRPTMLARDEVPLSQLNIIRLLAALSMAPLDRREVERLVLADAPLCFRLMRLVNSAIYGMRGNVQSVERALVVVGEDEFRKLATVALAGSLGHRGSHALLSLSLQRARFCELLASHLQQDPIEQYLVGLLSLLDAILQAPMSSLVDLLPLQAPVRAALLGECNATSMSLCIAKSYETGDWDTSAASHQLSSLGPDLINGLWIDAANWAEAALPARSMP
jgi:EAL and modified HD-GYP domain-containing signal transduction protein